MTEAKNAIHPELGRTAAEEIVRLLTIMRRLRDPEDGCPWDVKQDFRTIAPYTIEEAYEVADAIERGDLEDLRDELGDLLLQVVFHARMAEESGHFDFSAVTRAISDKMVRRHPHVFAEAQERDAESQTKAWETQKAEERAAKAKAEGRAPSVLEGISAALPPTTRALKLQKRAARVGFDWPEIRPVLEKIEEELAEIKTEIDKDAAVDRLEDELGDLLFAVTNLARHLRIDPDSALRRTNAKFEARFQAIEAALAKQGRSIEDADLDEMEELWQASKSK
ncbi:MAG: nucleoside triphosphate pyrophosphohydrolase [Limibacillus sp.]|jgi:ATP diphosphatase